MAYVPLAALTEGLRRMSRFNWSLAALLLIGCGGSPDGDPTSQSATGPNGPVNLDALRKLASTVTAGRLIDIHSGAASATLSAAEAEEIGQIFIRCAPMGEGNHIGTPPPWLAVIALDTTSGATLAAQFVDQGLRVDRATPFAPTLASLFEPGPVTVEDCALNETDAQRLWDLLTEKLGPTQEKTFQAIPPQK